MPASHLHSRAHSWASVEPRTTAWCGSSQYGKGGGNVKSYTNNENIPNRNRTSYKAQQRQLRTRSVPIIEDLENCCPEPERQLPKSIPKEKQVNISVKPVGKKMPAKTLAISPPSAGFWSWLPSIPTSTYNPRNELQRRTSPTGISFGPTFPTSPPLTPLTPLSPAGSHSFATKHNNFSTPVFGTMGEEQVFVLTLRTSDEIAQEMQTLRQKWFPANRLKVSAHVTLFHALPESRLPEVERQIVQLTQQTPPFQISAGRVMRMRKGVLVNLHEGDWDVRTLYGRLRSAFLDWLSEQDKSCKAHWTIQNKEEDQRRVDQAFEDVFNNATSSGMATGLVLWRYGDDGRWSKEKEYAFEGRQSPIGIAL